MSKRQANDRLAELVERIGLAEVWNQRIDALSKGFKRRVGIAQALVHDPDVLILDEPTDGLDPNQKHDMRELIRSIAPQKAIVISTHILEEVEAVCTRAIIIAKGRMLADATPAELLARPQGASALAITIATADPRRAIEIISTQPGISKVYVAERVNGVTRLLVHAPQSRPTAAELAGILGRSDIAVAEMFVQARRASTTCSARSRTERRTDHAPDLARLPAGVRRLFRDAGRGGVPDRLSRAAPPASPSS